MKDRVKILTTIILLLSVMFASMSFSGCGKTQTKLPPIKLPEYGCFAPHNFEVQLKVDASNIPRKMIVYKVKPFKIDKKETERLCKIFGVDISAVKINKDNFVVRRQGEKELEIYKKTGFYEFRTRNLYNHTPNKEVPGSKECIALAKSFVNKYKLLPNTYQYRTFIGSISSSHPVSGKESINNIGVTFRPVVNGIEIIGPKLDVIIGDKGKVEEVSSILYNITPVGNYALKPINEIIKELKENKATAWSTESDNPDADKLIIEKVEIKYYGDIGTILEMGQPFVQPVYKLSGEITHKNGERGEFSVYLPAVDN